MSFLFPQLLWGLLGLLPLMAVYLIRVHPIRKKTSAWFLWQGIFQERRAASWLQKMRDWLSLLIMILVFVLLVLALAQPVWNDRMAAERMVLIIDNSLSMNADGRLAEARSAARGYIRSLPAGGRAAIFSLSGELLSATGFSSSRRELMAGLESVVGSDVPFNVSALQHLTGEGDQENQRVLLFTDGCFQRLEDLPAGIELVKVGKPADNLGITAFDARRVPGDDAPVGIFFRIFSSASKPVAVDAVLSHGASNEVARVFPLMVDPGLNEPQIVYLPHGETGRWTLGLQHEDASERDNTAFAVVPESDPARVAVRAPETRMFWKLCVEAFGEGVQGLEMVETDAELELYRGAVESTSAERLAVFAPTGNSPFWRAVSGEPTEAVVRVVLPLHPLMRYANLDGMVVHGVRQLQLPDQAVVLAETDAGIPLIYKTTQQGRAAYVLNFDPAQNHFFLHPLYPVLVWSIAADLMEMGQTPAASVRPGAGVKLPGGFSEGHVQLPDGTTLRYADNRFGPLEHFGFYMFQGVEKSRFVACSGTPVQECALDNSTVADSNNGQVSGYPLSEWFLGAALLLLACECALYHRRKVG